MKNCDNLCERRVQPQGVFTVPSKIILIIHCHFSFCQCFIYRLLLLKKIHKAQVILIRLKRNKNNSKKKTLKPRGVRGISLCVFSSIFHSSHHAMAWRRLTKFITRAKSKIINFKIVYINDRSTSFFYFRNVATTALILLLYTLAFIHHSLRSCLFVTFFIIKS